MPLDKHVGGGVAPFIFGRGKIDHGGECMLILLACFAVQCGLQ